MSFPEDSAQTLGPPDSVGLSREEVQRMVLLAAKREEQVAPRFAPSCVVGPWLRADTSGFDTAYEAMRFSDTDLSQGGGFVVLRPGKIIGLTVHIHGGAIGGTSIEHQVYVEPNGGSPTATGIITSQSTKIGNAEGGYPVNPLDLVYVYGKRTGAVNNRESYACVHFEFYENAPEGRSGQAAIL